MLRRTLVSVSASLAIPLGASWLAAADLPAPRTVALWPQGALGGSVSDPPSVTAYLPSPEKSTGAGLLVFPGGGFTRRCEDHEGVLVAEWLRAHGVAAFLVRYRVVPMGTLKDALGDGHRAVQHVRANAREWGVSPQRLGAVGFSAGSVLAANVALRPSAARPDADDPVQRVASRPDFLVLAYGDANQAQPGLRGLAAQGLTPEEAATLFSPTAAEIAEAPPAFLFCTTEDRGQATNMADLYARLLGARRPVEAHFFGFGEHGVGFAMGDPLLGEWPSLALSWMRTSGLLTPHERVAVRGRVMIDGQPLPRGSVVLTPFDRAGDPAVVAYVFGTENPPGEFALRAERGPTPGRYRVEVRQDATRWLSNSRDPVYQRVQQKLRDAGALEPRDVEEWTASARAKDFSPSLENQRVYRRRRASDPEEMVMEIRAGLENRVDIEILSR